jgi:D-glycero-D-manno-heptose 1,7-bisphosphate phosphatase
VSHAAVFLDRDGVLNDPVWDPVDGRPESPLRPEDVRLAAGAAAAARRLHDAGLALIVVSNQPAAAKGKATADDLRRVHERVAALLAEAGVTIDDWRYCLHRAEDDCACRKPRPGMLLDAAHERGIDPAACWMVGDTDADVSAGRAAGTRVVLVAHPGSAHRRSGEAAPDAIVPDLNAAAAIILGVPSATLPV